MKNFIGMLYQQMLQGSYDGFVDITGTGYTGSPASTVFNVNAGAGVSNLGIVVGSGTTTPTPNNYQLAAQIANGTGSGQLSYGAVSLVAPWVSGGDIFMSITRSFTNSSPGTVTVAEIGIYAKNGTYTNCIIRDVLPSPISVDIGSIFSVEYKFKVTV